MKKILFAIIAICCAATANAQEETETTTTTVASHSAMDFQYGFKAGLLFTTYDSDADDIQAHFGNWGIICRFRFDNWSIQPEIHYATQGVRSLQYKVYQGDDNYDTYGTPRQDGVSSKLKLNLKSYNIQMPIIFKWYLPIQMWRGINVQAGPKLSQRFDYKISASGSPAGLFAATDENGERLVDNAQIRSFARDMNKFTVAADFGVGFDSQSGIGFDLRCSMGITPVFKGEKQRIFRNAHDRVWSIAFTYVF